MCSSFEIMICSEALLVRTAVYAVVLLWLFNLWSTAPVYSSADSFPQRGLSTVAGVGADSSVCIDPNSTDFAAARASVAVAFFGMSRSLNYTLPSIQKRVFDVLDRGDIIYDVFWYTMVSNDANFVRLDPFEVESLHPFPCKLSLEDQEAVQQRFLHMYLSARNATMLDDAMDPFNNSFNSLRNLLGSFHTQIELADMIHFHQLRSGFNYSAVLAIRPDTAMFKDVDIAEHLSEIASSERMKIWVPNFQHWFGGVNDRAAYGSPEAMLSYLRRGLHYRDSGYVGIGETHLRQYLSEQHIAVAPSEMRFVRVRAGGSLPIAERKVKKHKFQVIFNLPHDDPDLHQCVDFKRHKFKRSC